MSLRAWGSLTCCIVVLLSLWFDCVQRLTNRPGGVCAKAIQWSWGLQLAHWLEISLLMVLQMNLMNPMIRKQQRISIFAIFIQLMYCLSMPIKRGTTERWQWHVYKSRLSSIELCFEIGGGIPESSKLSHVPSIFMCTRYEMTCRDFIWRLPTQPWSLALRLGT